MDNRRQCLRLLAGIGVAGILFTNQLGVFAQRRSTQRRATQQSKTEPQSLDSQALNAATHFFNTFFTKCGESYFHYQCDVCTSIWLNPPGLGCRDGCINDHITDALAKGNALELIETRGLLPRTDQKTLSGADRLNGYEWRADIYFRFEGERTSTAQSWRDCCSVPFVVAVDKKQGQWNVALTGIFGIPVYFARPNEAVPYKKPNCDDARSAD
ncbi:MAG TPA: hypothetical protein VE863_22620 [Pyrinomonadaceae bacterium]|nr:hypothetical protein [Pyrinomonadaceae bacterium]